MTNASTHPPLPAFLTTTCTCFPQVYILLREGATPSDCLKATFSAHVLLQLWESKAAASKAAAAAAAAAAAGKAGSSSSSGSSGGASSSSGSGGSSSASGRGSTSATAASSSSKDKQQQGASASSAGGGSASADPSAATTSSSSSSGGPGGLLTPPTISVNVKETITKLKNLFKASADEQAAARQLLADAKPSMDQLYSEFSRQADRQGWKLPSTMLNPRETRILKVSALTATL
jgi:hypothetical protein